MKMHISSIFFFLVILAGQPLLTSCNKLHASSEKNSTDFHELEGLQYLWTYNAQFKNDFCDFLKQHGAFITIDFKTQQISSDYSGATNVCSNCLPEEPFADHFQLLVNAMKTDTRVEFIVIKCDLNTASSDANNIASIIENVAKTKPVMLEIPDWHRKPNLKADNIYIFAPYFLKHCYSFLRNGKIETFSDRDRLMLDIMRTCIKLGLLGHPKQQEQYHNDYLLGIQDVRRLK